MPNTNTSNTYRIIIDHPSVWHCTSHYISVHHCTMTISRCWDAEYRWLRWILACIAVKHGLWSSWFTAPNGVLATPRFFRCWPVINSLIWSYSPRNVHGFCIFFHHPSSFTMVYQCLPWVMMVYHVIYPGWNRKSLFASKQPLPLPRICILLLGPKKKSCGQMWPPETGWN